MSESSERPIRFRTTNLLSAFVFLSSLFQIQLDHTPYFSFEQNGSDRYVVVGASALTLMYFMAQGAYRFGRSHVIRIVNALQEELLLVKRANNILDYFRIEGRDPKIALEEHLSARISQAIGALGIFDNAILVAKFVAMMVFGATALAVARVEISTFALKTLELLAQKL